MTYDKTSCGFQIVRHPVYPPGPDGAPEAVLVQQSSAIGDYPDAIDKRGSSRLWIGTEFHLNREEIAALVTRLNHWLETGRLFD